jgi:hypothetical protein
VCDISWQRCYHETISYRSEFLWAEKAVIKKYRAWFGRPGLNTRQTRIFLMTTTPKPIFHRIWVRNGRSVKQTTEYHLFSRLSIRDAFMSSVRCWRFGQSGNREAGCGHCAVNEGCKCVVLLVTLVAFRYDSFQCSCCHRRGCLAYPKVFGCCQRMLSGWCHGEEVVLYVYFSIRLRHWVS